MEIIEPDLRKKELAEGFSYRKLNPKRMLKNCWAWNGKVIDYSGDIKLMTTVKVNTLIEMAEKYWFDGWIPVKGLDNAFLREMENELRNKCSRNTPIPDYEFLSIKELPSDCVLSGDKRLEGQEPISKMEVLLLDEFGDIRGTKLQDVDIPDKQTLKKQYS